ncbi:protein SHOOT GRAVITROPISM 6 [Neltuma alba]|uniref:protein SHOOT GRAVITROPISM 6 n=1 Tax=Neltuma alba TaxID=207710 RepID=UPI0010A50058|nr:protein SHOOT GRAVITROPISM 6-like [Prosopis alba]
MAMYPDVNKSRSREKPLTFSALRVLKYLLPRLSAAWRVRRPFLVEAVKFLLDEQSLGVKNGPFSELFFEYLVRNCALPNQIQSNIERVVRIREQR